MTVKWNSKKILGRVEEAIARGLFISAEMVRTRAIESILNDPKTGEIYTTLFFTIGKGEGRIVIPYGTRPAHQASAPGEAPASDTGTLVNSITTTIQREQLTATVSVHSIVGKYLEFGTDRMAPRPFMRPALDQSAKQIKETIVKEVRTVLKGAA